MMFFSMFRKYVKKLTEFGLGIALSSSMGDILYKIDKKNQKRSVVYFINEWKHFNIERYLSKSVEDIIEKYSNRSVDVNNKSEKNIWTMWWQGINDAPEEIEICLNSIKRFSKSHKLIIITKNNINQYISFPNYIQNKIDSGVISYTHLSDIVRVYLINNYGGLWLDSTIFVSREIPEEIFDYAYYTNKMLPKQIACVSKQRWAGYILAGKPNNIYCSFMLECFYKYWETEETLIDYFLIDYLTDIAYKELTEFKDLYDDLKIGNTMIDQLEVICNKPYDPEILAALFKDNVFFKLQRRNIHKKYDSNGENTFYGWIANVYLR